MAMSGGRNEIGMFGVEGGGHFRLKGRAVKLHHPAPYPAVWCS